MNNLNFSFKSVDIPDFFHEKKIKLWLNKIAESYNFKIGEISYLFCNDEQILETNINYLNHNYYTDVITFDFCLENILYGDILISLDTVYSNSQKYNTDYKEEFHRVISHGILHLIGFKDKTDGELSDMRKNENMCLEMLKTIINE